VVRGAGAVLRSGGACSPLGLSEGAREGSPKLRIPAEMSAAREKKRARKMRNQPASVTLPAEPGSFPGGGGGSGRACSAPGTASPPLRPPPGHGAVGRSSHCATILPATYPHGGPSIKSHFTPVLLPGCRAGQCQTLSRRLWYQIAPEILT